MKKVIMTIEVTVEDKDRQLHITAGSGFPHVEGQEFRPDDTPEKIMLSSDRETFVAMTIASQLQRIIGEVKDPIGEKLNAACASGNSLYEFLHDEKGAESGQDHTESSN